jgi:hypothetical protein
MLISGVYEMREISKYISILKAVIMNGNDAIWMNCISLIIPGSVNVCVNKINHKANLSSYKPTKTVGQSMPSVAGLIAWFSDKESDVKQAYPKMKAGLFFF